jgi:hypothetical protein
MVMPGRQKFRARKCVIHGITFDSKKEALRYLVLKNKLDSGEISDLKLQYMYQVVVNEVKVAKYYADFVYKNKEGVEIIEDVKSTATAKDKYYRLKKRLVEAALGIKITEILA